MAHNLPLTPKKPEVVTTFYSFSDTEGKLKERGLVFTPRLRPVDRPYSLPSEEEMEQIKDELPSAPLGKVMLELLDHSFSLDSLTGARERIVQDLTRKFGVWVSVHYVPGAPVYTAIHTDPSDPVEINSEEDDTLYRILASLPMVAELIQEEEVRVDRMCDQIAERASIKPVSSMNSPWQPELI